MRALLAAGAGRHGRDAWVHVGDRTHPLEQVMSGKSREFRITSMLPSRRITSRELPSAGFVLRRSAPVPRARQVPDAVSLPLQYLPRSRR